MRTRIKSILTLAAVVHFFSYFALIIYVRSKNKTCFRFIHKMAWWTRAMAWIWLQHRSQSKSSFNLSCTGSVHPSALLCHCFVFRFVRLNGVSDDADLLLCISQNKSAWICRNAERRGRLWIASTYTRHFVSIPPSLTRGVNEENATDENSLRISWKLDCFIEVVGIVVLCAPCLSHAIMWKWRSER